MSSVLVPKQLCGRVNEAQKMWRRVCRKALLQGGWAGAIEESDYIPLAEAPGRILLMDDSYGLTRATENVHAGMAYPVLADLSIVLLKGNNERFAECENLMLEASQRFWGCLCLLGNFVTFECPLYYTERAQLFHTLLSRVINWWPTFTDFGARFGDESTASMLASYPDSNWAQVGPSLVSMCREMGATEVDSLGNLHLLTMEEGMRMISTFLERTKKSCS